MKKIILSISALSLFSLAQADGTFSDYALTIKGGTTGVGAELTTNLTKSLNTRFSVSGLKYNTTTTDNDITYKADLSLLNVSLMLDYYAFDSSQFRISGGIVYNGNTLDLTGDPSVYSTFTIGDTVYTTNDVSDVQANVDYPKIAPYLGIGWGDAVKSPGWNFVADLGVMYQGNADVELTATTTLTGAAKAQLDAELLKEQTDLEDKLSKYKLYPVATIGVSYCF